MSNTRHEYQLEPCMMEPNRNGSPKASRMLMRGRIYAASA
jgi:hypothetical protein